MSYNKMQVPKHHEELMATISKEVIRAQPSDIIAFISDMVDRMVEIKKGDLGVENCNEPWAKDFEANLLSKIREGQE